MDVATEVFGAGKKQVTVFPIVGGTTIVMGLLLTLVFLTDLNAREEMILGILIGLMMVFGTVMWWLGKRSEMRNAPSVAGTEE